MFRVALSTVLALLCFAANSLLCRIALRHTSIDAATFTTVRILAGAVTLTALATARPRARRIGRGSWLSAGALFAYAIAFSAAYRTLPAGTGSLLLFGAVQCTMLGWGVFMHGERLRRWQIIGLVLAVAGVVYLLLPGVAAPHPIGAVLMLASGAAWGMYSLRGKGAADPLGITAGNFLLAVPMALAISAAAWSLRSIDRAGLMYAALSGAIASGIGYSIWYTALRGHSAVSAATVQLSVPVLITIGGVIFLRETITWRLVAAAAMILGGIYLVITKKDRVVSEKRTTH